MSDLTFFSDAFSISPYAMTVFVSLEEKAIPYHLVKVGLHRGEHKAATYRARTGRVPAIQHGDFVLAESTAITEYLEEAFVSPQTPKLFPADIKERAIARELMAWIRSDFHALREERPTTSIFMQRSKNPLSELGQAGRRKLIAALSPLLPEGKATLFDAWCIADLDVAVMLQRLNLNGEELPSNLRTYAENQWKRPSVAKWLSHPRDDYMPY
jgi:glutathione S-transferase